MLLLICMTLINRLKDARFTCSASFMATSSLPSRTDLPSRLSISRVLKQKLQSNYHLLARNETYLKGSILLSQLPELVDELLVPFLCFLALDLFLHSSTVSLLNLEIMLGTRRLSMKASPKFLVVKSQFIFSSLGKLQQF